MKVSSRNLIHGTVLTCRNVTELCLRLQDIRHRCLLAYVYLRENDRKVVLSTSRDSRNLDRLRVIITATSESGRVLYGHEQDAESAELLAIAVGGVSRRDPDMAGLYQLNPRLRQREVKRPDVEPKGSPIPLGVTVKGKTRRGNHSRAVMNEILRRVDSLLTSMEKQAS